MIKKTIIILGVCMIAFLVGTTFLVLNNNNPISEILKGNFLNEKTDYALVEQLKDDNLINELRTIDSSIQEGDLTKDYFALNKNVIIANDKETIIDLKLVSPYKVSGLIASPDTKGCRVLFK